MNILSVVLFITFCLLQINLWAGKGGLGEVWSLKRTVAEQKQKNAELSARNIALDAEVRDLKEGLAALEERARSELGMIKKGETFYGIIERTR